MKQKKLTQTFNTELFSEELLTKRVVKGRQNLQEAAKQIGITASTLSRYENKKAPDVYSYYACCKWLGLSMEHFFKAPEKAKK